MPYKFKPKRCVEIVGGGSRCQGIAVPTSKVQKCAQHNPITGGDDPNFASEIYGGAEDVKKVTPGPLELVDLKEVEVNRSNVRDPYEELVRLQYKKTVQFPLSIEELAKRGGQMYLHPQTYVLGATKVHPMRAYHFTGHWATVTDATVMRMKEALIKKGTLDSDFL